MSNNDLYKNKYLKYKKKYLDLLGGVNFNFKDDIYNILICFLEDDNFKENLTTFLKNDYFKEELNLKFLSSIILELILEHKIINDDIPDNLINDEIIRKIKQTEDQRQKINEYIKLEKLINFHDRFQYNKYRPYIKHIDHLPKPSKLLIAKLQVEKSENEKAEIKSKDLYNKLVEYLKLDDFNNNLRIYLTQLNEFYDNKYFIRMVYDAIYTLLYCHKIIIEDIPDQFYKLIGQNNKKSYEEIDVMRKNNRSSRVNNKQLNDYLNEEIYIKNDNGEKTTASKLLLTEVEGLKEIIRLKK